MRVLVTGVSGQLGYDVVRELKENNHEVIKTSRKDFDITNKKETFNFIKSSKAEVIIHCAAYTAVDSAEEDKEVCYSVNVDGTRNIAEIAKEVGSKLLYVSTDYVFDGKGTKPHKENSPTNPTNYYGYTKELGEQAVKNLLDEYFIVRTSWVYGINGNNFVKTMLRLSEGNKELSVVSDQIGAPTYTRDLSRFIVDLIQTNKYGIYHGVNEGYCSWYELAQKIFEHSKKEINVSPVTTDKYPTKAKRPLNSRLAKSNTDKAKISRLPLWEDGLMRFLKELEEENK